MKVYVVVRYRLGEPVVDKVFALKGDAWSYVRKNSDRVGQFDVHHRDVEFPTTRALRSATRRAEMLEFYKLQPSMLEQLLAPGCTIPVPDTEE